MDRITTVTVRPSHTANVDTNPVPSVSTPSRPVSTPTPTPQPTSVPPVGPIETPALLRLRDNLDDPLGYCIDVAGFGANIRLDAPLPAHTCKPNSPDQLFAMTGDARSWSVLLTGYGPCLETVQADPGA